MGNSNIKALGRLIPKRSHYFQDHKSCYTVIKNEIHLIISNAHFLYYPIEKLDLPSLLKNKIYQCQ
jgi:hypothetical protein